MAKCKLCKKLINDGTEYCADCVEKKDLVADESYLDDLLNSVQNKVITAGDIYKTKKEGHKDDSPTISAPTENDTIYSIDPSDLGEFERLDFMKEFDDPIVISDEELYEDVVAHENEDNEELNNDDANNDDSNNEEPKNQELNNYKINNDELNNNDNEQEDSINLDTINFENEDEKDIEHNIDNEFLDMDESKEESLLEDENIEPVLDDLLKHLNLSDDNDNTADHEISYDTDALDNILTAEEEITPGIEFASESGFEEINEDIAPENELLELLNQFNPDNQSEDDIQAISDLLGGIDASNKQIKGYPEDVGEVFSEALEAVADLSDIDQGNLLKQEPIGKGDTKVKKDKKKGALTKLFANTTDEDFSPEKRKASDDIEATKEEKKKRKKKKGKKDQVADNEVGEEVSARGNKDTKPSKERSKEKKPKKEKKKKIEILDDYVDEGHINKAGASIVFLFFGLLVVLLLISTNIFSYSLSINNATDYFDKQRYTQAYNEVYGIELKDEDIELYDKIMTVMYVNKQLNSYNNYYHMRKFPEALDSLLKGLQRYDKYIELATMLGINTDLDYVRNQIIAELYNVFNLTEEQAIYIINSESQAKYSIAVYDVILEDISFYN